MGNEALVNGSANSRSLSTRFQKYANVFAPGR